MQGAKAGYLQIRIPVGAGTCDDVPAQERSIGGGGPAIKTRGGSRSGGAGQQRTLRGGARSGCAHWIPAPSTSRAPLRKRSLRSGGDRCLPPTRGSAERTACCLLPAKRRSKAQTAAVYCALVMDGFEWDSHHTDSIYHILIRISM